MEYHGNCSGFEFFGLFVCLILLIISAIKKQPVKPFAIGMAVCLVLFFAMPTSGDTSDKPDTSGLPESCVAAEVASQQEEAGAEESAAAETSAQKPQQEGSDQSAPQFMEVYGQNVIERVVMNGAGTERIGTRGLIRLLESELTDEALTQICKDIDGLDYNWFTVETLDSDGKGIVFPGCMAIAGTYGELTEEGSVEHAEKVVTVTDTGYTLEDLTE